MLKVKENFDPARQWSKEDLRRVRSGIPEDRAITTTFLNAKTVFSTEEMLAYPYWLRKVYEVELAFDSKPIVFYATDDEMAIEYLKARYDLEIQDLAKISLEERITSYREVNLPEGGIQ